MIPPEAFLFLLWLTRAGHTSRLQEDISDGFCRQKGAPLTTVAERLEARTRGRSVRRPPNQRGS